MDLLVSYILTGGVLLSVLLLVTGYRWPGIYVLLATPYVRVLASFLFFAFKERNIKYTIFTGLVLAVLTYSLLLR